MSVDISQPHFTDDTQNVPVQELNIPFLLILIGTGIGLYLMIYAHGVVVATLTATEANTASTRHETHSTSSRHPLRGLSIFIFHRLLKALVISLIPISGFSLLGCFTSNVVADLLLSNLKVANVHAIMAQKPRISFFRHILSLETWWKTLPVTILYSTVSSICFYVPVSMIRGFGKRDQFQVFSDSAFTTQLCFTIVTICALYFGAVVPAYAMFIRVAVFVFSKETKSKRQLGHTQMSIITAWRSFSWLSWVQFYRVLGQVFLMEFGVALILFLVTLALFHPDLHNDVALFVVKYAG